MLEEFELHQQEIIKADHIINFIDGEYEHKPQEKLPKGKPALEAIPDRDHANAQYHENAEHHECPPDGSRAIKQFIFSWPDHLLGFLWR